MRAKWLLEQHGFSDEDFMALHRAMRSHADKRGGQHTNGGCGRGRCDYGSPTCAAWSKLLDIIGCSLREPQP